MSKTKTEAASPEHLIKCRDKIWNIALKLNGVGEVLKHYPSSIDKSKDVEALEGLGILLKDIGTQLDWIGGDLDLMEESPESNGLKKGTSPRSHQPKAKEN